MRILATAPLRGPGLDELRALGEVVEEPWITSPTEPIRLLGAEQLAERLADLQADVVICEADSVKGPVLDLPLVAVGSTRGDPTNVDIPGATAKGIPVLRAPARNADAVAELAVGLLIACTRGIVVGDRDVRTDQVFAGGTIPNQRYRAWEIAGRTIGLVGYGAVARAAKWRFEGLGLRVLSADPYANDATHHDLDALVAALEDGHVSSAGLDHFDGEVLPAGHPLIGMSNVVLTPHIGGATFDCEANHTRAMADGLAALLRGERPSNHVNPEALD